MSRLKVGNTIGYMDLIKNIMRGQLELYCCYCYITKIYKKGHIHGAIKGHILGA